MSRVPVVAALLVLVLAGSLVPAATASSPPERVCPVCDQQFEEAAHELDLNATVDRSSLRVDVRDDGSSRWTARVTLSPETAPTYRDDPAQLREVVDTAFEAHNNLVEDPRNVSVRFEDRTAVVGFTVPDVAHRGVGGVLVVDYFHTIGGRYTMLNADEFVVAGPSETVVANDPPGDPGVGDGLASWESDRGYTQETFVVFADDDGAASRAAAEASVALAVGPRLVRDALLLATAPTLLFAAALGSLRGSDRFAEWSLSTAAAVSAGLPLLGLAVSTVTVTSTLAARLVMALPLLVIPLVAVAVADWLSPRRMLALVGLTLLAQLVAADAVGLGWGLAGFAGGGASALLLPALLFFPAGGLAADSRTRTRAWRAHTLLVVSWPLLVTTQFVPLTGFEFLLLPAFLAWAAGTLLVGTPLFALGRAVAGSRGFEPQF
ncbi:hypothetical protein [Haloarchaeobius amylolyticus]|uniref:hypothetical protein n=1 Tax=Haloarchaeobius amylolyticus TaxID=1198296 RepID=UPI002270916A|nr:hypothetical protein [Haloarchaeobius amylolyticus]